MGQILLSNKLPTYNKITTTSMNLHMHVYTYTVVMECTYICSYSFMYVASGIYIHMYM